MTQKGRVQSIYVTTSKESNYPVSTARRDLVNYINYQHRQTGTS